MADKMLPINLTEKDIERFWSKVNVKGDDDCWEWMAGKTSSGYGAFYANGRMNRANRIAYTISNEQIPEKLLVLHKCDNPICCNPGHLFLGTQGDNVRDMWSKGRDNHPVGNRCGSAKLTVDQVIEIRASGGTCRYLADKYGVGKSTIAAIKIYDTWKHVK